MGTTTESNSSLRDLLFDERVWLAALIGGAVIVYGNTLAWVADFWERPEYSHGYLIPAFSCALLWLRRPSTDALPQREQQIGLGLIGIGVVLMLLVSSFPQQIASVYPVALEHLVTAGQLAFLPALTGAILLIGKIDTSGVTDAERWAGLGIVAAGLLLRMVLTHFALVTPEMLTLLPTLTGLVVLVGGWRLLAWSWPAIAFLIFMFPLPDIVERELLNPLQALATRCSTFCLQTLGLPVYREGNRIVMGEMHLGVVDACSGLRMLTIFIALSTAITLVTDRPIWERIAIIFSAIPIALTVNIARITITGVLYRVADHELAEKVFHDLAGWVMMPMALGLLYCELQILSHLVHDDTEEMPVGMMHASGEPV